MIFNYLSFDIEKWLKSIIAPYVTFLSVLIFLCTLALSVVLLVPDVRSALGFQLWSDTVIIMLGLAWFVGVIISFVSLLQVFRLNLNQFGNLFVVTDVLVLVLIIAVTAIMPGQQICSINDPNCTVLDNIVWNFMILQLPILGSFLAIKMSYLTGSDPLLILSKIFRSK